MIRVAKVTIIHRELYSYLMEFVGMYDIILSWQMLLYFPNAQQKENYSESL